jgi:crotonobetaine/carnitine-CoA ligase
MVKTSEFSQTDILPADVCVVRYALERHARERNDGVFAVFEEGGYWTFGELMQQVRTVAAGLQALGVRQDDKVIVMMPNCSLSVTCLYAINYLGAVSVPINTALKGKVLEHVINDSGAALAIIGTAFLDALTSIALRHLKTVVATRGQSDSQLTGLEILGESALRGAPESLKPPERDIQPWDLQSIIYTSGTTGLSKGVLSSYMHSFSSCNPNSWQSVCDDDRHLLHMPIFHIGGAFIASMALCIGGSIAVVEKFKTETFWDTIRDLEVTTVFLLGAMATFLLKRPPSAQDRQHGLRSVILVPLGGNGPEFRERFGVDVFTLFNMTEISTPLFAGPNPAKANVCGRPRPGVDVRLVDDHDCPVTVGTSGELVVRTVAPWAMNHGYHNNAEATAASWRNGWFHTGDAFVADNEGDYFFVDRLKDTIRRRGENISSYEVEVELLAHPQVREAAAIPVPSEYSEDDVMVVLSPTEDDILDPMDIFEFLCPRLARFMLPRYIRIVEALPKTATTKVKKHILREQGLTADTWDRDKAGVGVHRNSN